MFKKFIVKNSLKPSLKIVHCQSRELVTDLNEHEQEMISGSGGRDDAWALAVKITEKQKPFLVSNFRVDLGGL